VPAGTGTLFGSQTAGSGLLMILAVILFHLFANYFSKHFGTVNMHFCSAAPCSVLCGFADKMQVTKPLFQLHTRD